MNSTKCGTQSTKVGGEFRRGWTKHRRNPAKFGTDSTEVGRERPVLDNASAEVCQIGLDIGHIRPEIGDLRRGVGHNRPNSAQHQPKWAGVRPGLGLKSSWPISGNIGTISSRLRSDSVWRRPNLDVAVWFVPVWGFFDKTWVSSNSLGPNFGQARRFAGVACKGRTPLTIHVDVSSVFDVITRSSRPPL